MKLKPHSNSMKCTVYKLVMLRARLPSESQGKLITVDARHVPRAIMPWERSNQQLISETILRRSSSVFFNDYAIYSHISVCAAYKKVTGTLTFSTEIPQLLNRETRSNSVLFPRHDHRTLFWVFHAFEAELNATSFFLPIIHYKIADRT
jgi:hypothetical protein